MHKSKGFTLIELVVVIAIIGILAGIAIPYYTEAQATARGARILADMRTIQAAYTMYLAKNGGEQNNLVVGSTNNGIISGQRAPGNYSIVGRTGVFRSCSYSACR